MNVFSRTSTGIVGGALACFLLAGCGGKSKPYPVKGTLTKGGKPLPTAAATGPAPPGTEESSAPGVEMRFYPYDGTKRPTEPSPFFAAPVKADGSFEVPGTKGNGIPAGKYLVVVRHKSVKPGASEFAPDTAESSDKLGGAFSEQQSPIVIEINGPTEDLKIELNDYKGKKAAP